MSDVHRFAWQGLEVVIPAEWDPVRLEGDFETGSAMLADLERSRVGVRWQKVRGKALSRAEVQRQIDRAMRDEVGALAAQEAKDIDAKRWPGAKMYVEPDPPGRDVFIGYSEASHRLVQLVYQVEKPRRDRMLSQMIVPTLNDESATDEQRWSVFELSCRVPTSLRLATHKLMAGDLSLSFASVSKPVEDLTVRQIGVAQLALKRMPLDQWLRRQQSLRSKHYRASKEQQEAELSTEDARELKGLRGTMRRRRRFFFLRRRLPESMVTFAYTDEARDRIVIVESNDEALAQRVAATVGTDRAERAGVTDFVATSDH